MGRSFENRPIEVVHHLADTQSAGRSARLVKGDNGVMEV